MSLNQCDHFAFYCHYSVFFFGKLNTLSFKTAGKGGAIAILFVSVSPAGNKRLSAW